MLNAVVDLKQELRVLQAALPSTEIAALLGREDYLEDSRKSELGPLLCAAVHTRFQQQDALAGPLQQRIDEGFGTLHALFGRSEVLDSIPSLSHSKGIRAGITVQCRSFLRSDSEAAQGRWNFGYHVRITNNSAHDMVQVRRRHWKVLDSMAPEDPKVYDGDSVLGCFPQIHKGESFDYESQVTVLSSLGVMSGSFEFLTADGTELEVQAMPFALSTRVEASSLRDRPPAGFLPTIWRFAEREP